MKKFLVLIFAAVLSLALASCNFLTDISKLIGDDDAPLTRTDSPYAYSPEEGEKSLNYVEPSGSDIGSIIEGLGGSGLAWGSMSEELKEKIINAAKEKGYNISFDENGSPVLTGNDGSQLMQNEDGSWAAPDDGGSSAQLGGSWPDNEYTRQIPAPGFSILAAREDEDAFTASFTGVTVDRVRAYTEKVKAAGFTVDSELQDETVMGMSVYSYSASNENGFTLSISFSAGMASIEISR